METFKLELKLSDFMEMEGVMNGPEWSYRRFIVSHRCLEQRVVLGRSAVNEIRRISDRTLRGASGSAVGIRTSRTAL